MTTEHNCFCELAPLYALNLVNEQERLWVEQQVAECPELAEELATYQSAVTAIPYSAAPVPMAADLKDRLFDRLGLNSPTPAPVEVRPAPMLAVRSSELDWQPHSIPGVSVATIHIDSAKREKVGLLRAEPGACYPFHRHAAIEELYMLEGELVIGEQVYRAGDYIRSQPGSGHAPYTTGGCMFFFRTSLDDEYPDLEFS